MTTHDAKPSALGIHHVTAICGDPQRNLDFYAGVLGLRFVKRTVNFDDPGTYHFYYGDEAGTPGSILTFFPWPAANRGRIGVGQVAVTSFAVPPAALGFWIERLLAKGVRYQGPTRGSADTPGDHQVLAFADPDGLLLQIVAMAGAAGRPGWDGAPGIDAAHSLRGFHSVTLWESAADPTAKVLVDALGFGDAEDHDGVRVYAADDGGPGERVYVRSVGGFPLGMGGVGTVHHVALRAADSAAQLAIRARLTAARLDPTPVIDRTYFRSVYFHEPGGVLCELATDDPGFTVDEPIDRLGEGLMLPPGVERLRAQIESILPSIHIPGAEGAATSGTDA
jgi:glyoxalase family protein